jgi:hypothetical protein
MCFNDRYTTWDADAVPTSRSRWWPFTSKDSSCIHENRSICVYVWCLLLNLGQAKRCTKLPVYADTLQKYLYCTTFLLNYIICSLFYDAFPASTTTMRRMTVNRWIMNCKVVFVKKRSWPNFKVWAPSGIRLDEMRKTMKTSVRIASLRAEILTRDLPNTKQEKPLGVSRRVRHMGKVSVLNTVSLRSIGNGGIAPHILNLGTRWMPHASLAPRHFCPWRKPHP